MDIYKTKNLFIATFLLCHKELEFHGATQLDSKTKFFCFTPKETATQLENAYFSGASVPAKDLFNNYNTLKDLLFQRESNGEEYGNTRR